MAVKNEADKMYALRDIGRLVGEIDTFEHEIAYRKGLVRRLSQQITDYENFGKSGTLDKRPLKQP